MTEMEKLIEFLESHETLPSYFSEFLDFYKKGIPFDEWREFANSRKKALKGSSGIMLGILEDQWSSINYHHLEREDYYSLRESPLEILHFCIADDFLTYPPPEILWTIAMQFQWYMENEGKVTLEEAFFGKPIKSKGSYAKRMADERTKLYKAFHLKTKVNPNISQSQLLENFCNKAIPDGIGSKDTCNPIYEANQKKEIDQDSFLRGYRRWKKTIKTDK